MRDKLKKFRGKSSCQRCNQMCDDDKLLNRHREENHCEYKVNDSKRDIKKVKSNIHIYRHPPRADWITKMPTKQIYMWDPWDGCYYQYKKGSGLVNDLDVVIADENSDYYKTLTKIIRRGTPLDKICKQPTKPKPSSLPSESLPTGKIKLRKGDILCKSCNRIVRIHGPKPTNILICPCCNRNAL